MGLFKRGNVWYVDISINGQRYKVSAETTSRKEAQEFEKRYREAVYREVKLGDSPQRYWEEAALRWLDEKQHKRSLSDDKVILKWIQPHLAGARLLEISRERIVEIGALKARETSPARANRILALISGILRQAVEWGWLDSCPPIKFYKEEEKPIKFLSETQVQLLLSFLPEHTKLIVIFALATGLRHSNITGLTWGCIDLEKRLAWIQPDEAKGKKAIGIPLNDVAMGVIESQKGKHPEYVFTYRGRPVLRVNGHAWFKAVEKAGLKGFRFHDLRHTWASYHAINGTPLRTLQELGGWSDQTIVLRYAHLNPEHLRQYAGVVVPNMSHPREGG